MSATVKAKPGPKPSGKPKKPGHTVYLSHEAEQWIRDRVPRSISTSKFVAAAVDFFIKDNGATRFISRSAPAKKK